MTDFNDSLRKPTSIVAIGVGNRMRTYMHYVASHPDEARLVAVVEPDPIRRNAMADQFGLPEEWLLSVRRNASISNRVWKLCG